MKTQPSLVEATCPGTMAGRSRITCARRILPLLLLLIFPIVSQAKFEYTVESGAVTITRYTGPGGDVIIPDTIAGRPVTSIGEWAFSGCTGLNLTIPSDVLSISGWNLTSVRGLGGGIGAGGQGGWREAGSGVVINEFMASNGSTLADEDGDYEDWIELFNAGAAAVNLEGFGLTDDPERPFQWVFPSVTIDAGGYVLVWASGKDWREVGEANGGAGWESGLHTNFRISADGEPLELSAPDGTVVDRALEAGSLRDVSWGRQPDGGEEWLLFPDPTPRGANLGRGHRGALSPPEVSHESGFYSEAIEVVLWHPDPEVTILYTLDGSTPEARHVGGGTFTYKNGYPQDGGDPFGELLTETFITLEYRGPIPVRDRSGDPDRLTLKLPTWERVAGSFFFDSRPKTPVYKGTVLRTRAVKEDALPSPMVTRSYFVSAEGSRRYDLPVVSVVIAEEDLFDYETGIYVAGADYDRWREANPEAEPERRWRLPANYGRRGGEWEKPVEVVMLDPDRGVVLDQSAGIRIDGGDLRSFPQKSFRLYAREGYDGRTGFRIDLFGEANETESEDEVPSFARILFHSVSAKWSDAIFSEIIRPGACLGQRSRPMHHFFNGEYWGLVLARDRMDEHFLAGRFGLNPENVIVLEEPWRLATEEQVEQGRPEDMELYRDLYRYATAHDLSEEEHYRHVESLLDIDSYLDYHIMYIYHAQRAPGTTPVRFWRVRDVVDEGYGDGRWRVMVWDFDRANHDPMEDTLGPVLQQGTSGFAPEAAALFRSMLSNEGFRNRFIGRFAAHINSAFLPERVAHIAEGMLATMKTSYPEYLNRWGSRTMPGATNWVEFGAGRPEAMRSHLRRHLELGEDVLLNLAVSHRDRGRVRVSGVDIRAGTEMGYPAGGRADEWSGVYFAGTPVELRAAPEAGYRFAGWEGLPAGTPGTVWVDPAEVAGTVRAVFAPEEDWVLAHYWSFNREDEPMAPTYTFGGGRQTIEKGDETEVEVASGAEFTGANAWIWGGAGLHLRVNHPLGSVLSWQMPTTGFSDVEVAFEARRSGQGAGLLDISYTTDGVDYAPYTQVLVDDATPRVFRLDFAAMAGVDDNPVFGVRVEFGEGAGGTAGNNRFDNVTVRGRWMGTENRPPEVWPVAGLWRMDEGGAPGSIDLGTVFRDPDGDALGYAVETIGVGVVEWALADSTLWIWPRRRGETRVWVSATDGFHRPVQAAFRVLVYPDAWRVIDGVFGFGAWAADRPEGAYPEHMMFLQSDRVDPGIEAPVDWAYWIAPEDYHEDDAGTVGFPYNNTRRTRINGLGEEGISFLNTGWSRDLGGALVALDTRGAEAVQVGWLTGTVRANERAYGLRLEYRVGNEGPFVNVTEAGEPVEYRAGVDGEMKRMGPVWLPEAALGRERVQLLWRYYWVAGKSGPRAELRLDEVWVAGFGAEIESVLRFEEVGEAEGMISWPVALRGHRLESSERLGPGAVWREVEGAGPGEDERVGVMVEVGEAARFFRLIAR